MSDDTRRALEAILMVADTPTPTETLAGLVDTSGERVDSLLVELAAVCFQRREPQHQLLHPRAQA